MKVVHPPRTPRRRKRYPDTLAVASCLILASGLGAATPPRFSSFFQEDTSILSVGHDASGQLYVYGVRSNGPHFVARLKPDASEVAYSLELNGTGCDQGSAMAVDGAGNLYIAGRTSPDNNRTYPCVLKLDSSGKMVYSFVVERTAAAEARAIAIDPGGSAWITGYASEFGFPSTGGAFSAPESSLANFFTRQPFIARVDPAGTKLVASAIGVGGSQIAIGPRGDIFVSGSAAGMGVGDGPAILYPITPGAFQSTFTPSFDCTSFLCQVAVPSPEQYVTRLPSTLTSLVYSTFVTGSRGAANRALAVDSAGNVYLSGTTNSTDYPYFGVEKGAPRPGLFLTKLDPTGKNLVWSVRQGGDFLAFDVDGNPILSSSVFPPGGLPYQRATYPPLPPTGGIPDACLPNGVRVQIAAAVQRLSAQDGSVLATQLVSATRAQPSAMEVLPDGRILVAGASVFPDIPLTPGVAFAAAVAQRTPSGAFLAAFDLASASLGGALACVADGLTNLPLGPVAPGELITLFGSGLGPADSANASPYGPDPVPTVLGGVTVTFDGVAAPLTYASSTQINATVPWEVRGKTSTVMAVTVDGNVVATREFAVAASNPALFVDTAGTAADGNSNFPAVALNVDGSRNSPTNPAGAGSWVTLFLNGVAAYPGDARPANGSITGQDSAPVAAPVTVTAGTLALETGPLAPQAGAVAGLSQVQVRVPGLGAGGLHALALTVTVGDVPAAPLVYFDKVYQAGGWIWVN